MSVTTQSGRWHRPAMGLGLGVVVGLVLGGLWAPRAMQAVATDREESFAMATGLVDDGIEAVYTLDFLSGQLSAAVVNPQSRQFSMSYQRQIAQDFGLEAGKNPKFLMVTGQNELRGGGQAQFGGSILYVAELGSGKMASYAIPFNRSALNRPGAVVEAIVLLQVVPFRGAAIRGQ